MQIASASPQARFGKKVNQSDFERVQAFLKQKHPQIADGFKSSEQCYLVNKRRESLFSRIQVFLQRNLYHKATYDTDMQPETRYVACLEKLPNKKATDKAVDNEFWGAFKMEGDSPDARSESFGLSRGLNGLCASAHLFYRFSDTELLRVHVKDNSVKEFTLPDQAPNDKD